MKKDFWLSIKGLSQLKNVLEASEYVELKRKLGFQSPDTEELPYTHKYPRHGAGGMREAVLLSIHRYFSVNSALRTCAGTASDTAVWTPRTSQRSKFYYKSRIVRFKPDRFKLA